jgi:uncharacterized protein (DUF885 family)
VDALADEFLVASVALDPIAATLLGLPGGADRLTDLSPQGHRARAALRRQTLHRMGNLTAQDEVDAVTLAALAERLGLEVALHEAGFDTCDLNNVASPVQAVREVFDISATTTLDDWDHLARRLHAVDAALAGYRHSLLEAAAGGRTAARRQVLGVAEQAEGFAAADGFFAAISGTSAAGDGTVLPDPLRADLVAGASAAAGAYADLAAWLRREYAALAREQDAVGRQDYPLLSREFLGTTIDPEEAYAWGRDELAAVGTRMRAAARRIVPSATGPAAVDEAIAALDADPERSIEGAEAFRDWMQQTSDAALAALADRHFDIPQPIRTLRCRIAPSTSGVIYYTGPADDLSRPGEMWWAVPAGVTRFSTWRETSTVYHEGVPGHHLQIGQTVFRRDVLNSWRRLGCWVSGHGEGWALYAERLMEELGHLDDPGDLMGLLDAQSLRAARVVVDIGLHCRLKAPDEVGGGVWDPQKAWAYLRAHTRLPEENLRFELERYLGWPGQAPAYKLGERVWLDLREQVRSREGAGFDLAAFHRRALDLGSLGLDVLRDAVLGHVRA